VAQRTFGPRPDLHLILNLDLVHCSREVRQETAASTIWFRIHSDKRTTIEGWGLSEIMPAVRIWYFVENVNGKKKRFSGATITQWKCQGVEIADRRGAWDWFSTMTSQKNS
jgi:hypothetical protein